MIGFFYDRSSDSSPWNPIICNSQIVFALTKFNYNETKYAINQGSTITTIELVFIYFIFL